MSDQDWTSDKLTSLDIDSLSFDSFQRSANDIVCLAPIQTIIRREEEIVLVRRVRKVEEIDASPACPINTFPPRPPVDKTGKLIVYANAGLDSREQDSITDRRAFVQTLLASNKLPCISNDQDTPIRITLESEGTWNYGPAEFSTPVSAEGNLAMQPKEESEGDMLFTQARPAALVAFRIEDNGNFSYTPVAHGEQLQREIELPPYGKLYFINNDQPGFYYDNSSYLTVRWKVVG